MDFICNEKAPQSSEHILISEPLGLVGPCLEQSSASYSHCLSMHAFIHSGFAQMPPS